MSCFICRRGGCTSSFHSIEQQQIYEPAERAYEKYLEVREKCEQEWLEVEEQDTGEEDADEDDES